MLVVFSVAATAAAAPTAVSVTPSSGSGTTQTFAFLYSDTGGVGRITYAQALINAANSWPNACAILYIQNGTQLYLVNDAGNGWQGPLTPGVAGTLQNNQCTLDAGASSISAVGNNLTVNAALSFKPAFGGSKIVLLDAEDIPGHLSSGFQSLGTWTVPAAAPTAVSVTPSSGTGSSQTFSFLYSDAGGVGRITYVQALINAANSWPNACAILYIQNGTQLYLVNDAGNGWQGPLTPGVAGTLQNNQCTLDAGASSVSAVGNNLTVNAALSFKPAFGGNKIVLLDAEDTVNHLSSGFQSLGTWTVSTSAPSAVSVTPSSGTGSSQTFSFLYSDAGGVGRITYAQALINAANSWPNACAILYIQNGTQLYLVNDAGNGWQGPLTPGVAGTLQNNQCTLDAGASSVSAVGNNLTVNAALSFKPAFSGSKIVLLDAEDIPGHLSSGFQSLGTWTVPAAAPTAVSVTPSSGTGTSQTFSFLYSDAGGVGRITYAQVLINAANSWPSACAILYIQNGTQLYLVNDAGNGWQGPLTPGVAGTLQNNQCTLDAGASSVSAVGNNLTVNAALTFKPAFGGSKIVLLDAEDTVNHLSSGFQSLGTWTVPAAAPTAVSVTPSSGSGTTQTFAFLYSDTGGVSRISYAQALINAANSWPNACAILYIQNGTQLYLVNDVGNGWQGPLTPGVAGTLQNNQCTLDAGASSISAVGNNLTVNAALTFKPAFSGSKVVLLDAENTANRLSSGFQSLGTWTVPNSTPAISSISPTSIAALSGDTVLTVNGSSFLASSAVELSGLSLTTTFQSSSQLTATIPASMISNPGTVPITVMTPGGGVSNAKNLTIAQAVTVSPSTRTVPVNWTRLFTATVAGETNQSVTWQVNDVTGGSASTGTITAGGIYISPNTVPGNNTVTVKAVSVANASKYGTAVVTITLPVSDNYPRSDASSILDTAPALPQVPLQGTIAAVLDWTAKDSSAANESVSKPEEVLAVCNNLNEMGIPHIHTTDWNVAKTYPMVAVVGVLETNAVTNTERDALAAYVQNGGTLLLWRPSDAGLLSRLGVTASSTFTGTDKRQATFSVPSTDGAVRYIDDDVEVHWQMEYWSLGTTREYTVGSAAAIATWDSGKAAIARSNLGTGRAYMFGYRLKNVIADAELQNIPVNPEPQWVNTQVLDADIVRLMVRGIYETLPSSPHVRQMAPNGKPAALILTHDVDAKVSYDNLPQYLALENAKGVKATYLFTTAAYDSGWVETMYTASGKANIQSALDQGFDIQSHSFDHYRDFDHAPYGTGNENAQNYLPHYSADLGYTINSSALGEVGVSRWLLRHDFGVEIPAFRSGYLLMPTGFMDAVQQVGYRRDSTYAAGLTRGFTPFIPFKMVNGAPVTFRFVEYPMGLEDRNMDATNVTQIVDSWEQVIRTNYKNGVPTVINIHPVNQPRLDAMQLLFERISDLDIWIGDWKTFGDFWESQGMTCSRWP